MHRPWSKRDIGKDADTIIQSLRSVSGVWIMMLMHRPWSESNIYRCSAQVKHQVICIRDTDTCHFSIWIKIMEKR
ncbi:hypothetical protein XELAEV_18012166mg [Xenopus laevis]|uniref:Uncharacterized protein n=1 Tax=Xenopus laevis TaxID=8355 RepID=A0A974DM20_XENLA|nr:hypothetical protein XELAEV_18012166mg [Xenopus laevis]